MSEELKKKKLTTENISDTCDEVQEFFKESHTESREAIRVRFLIEETLLNYKDKFGEEVEYEIFKNRKLFKSSVQLVVYSDKFNPFESDDEGVMNSLMTASTKQNPSWQYVKTSFEWLFTSIGRNEIIFAVPRESKTSNPAKIGIGLLAGIVLGTLARIIFSAEGCIAFSNDYILPTANIYTGLLSVMAILMCFFSLPLTIVQYKNASDFSESTKKTILSFVTLTVFAVLISAGICFAIFGRDEASSNVSAVFKSLFDVVVSFFPSSLFTPFINFDCMQIMFIGAFFGFAFLAMGDRSKDLVNLFDKTNLVAVLVNSFFTKFVSIYVFFMAFYLVMSSILSELSKMLYLFIITIAGCVIAMFLFIAIVSIKTKVPMKVILKKFMPAFVINLSSANMGPAFMEIFGELSRDCGIEEGFVGVSLNLGSIIYKPMYSLFMTAAAFSVAHMYGVLTIKLAIQIIFLAIILPCTIPNVQGGATSVLIVMFGQIGLATHEAELVISLNALLQYVIVPVNVVCLQCAIILEAYKNGKLNIDKLKA